MIDVNELESKWLNYKLREWLPIVISSLILIVVFLLIAVFFYNNGTAESKKPAPFHSKKETPANIEKTVVKNTPSSHLVESKSSPQKQTLPQQRTKVQQTILKPSMKFLDSFQGTIPHADKQNNPIHEKKHKNVSQKNSININTDNGENELSMLVKRFQKTNDPKLALFIAKVYYKHQKYKSAYNFALMTNEIDNTLDESWIIFAKSLVKLGKKKMAVVTLRQYIAHSGSNEAKILLKDINTGKFQ